MLFISYPNCSTCQRAKKWLESNRISYKERNIKEQNPSYEELHLWHKKSGLSVKRFFNTSGLLYRSMNLKEKLSAMNEEEQLRLLAADGMLVKRPLLIHGDSIFVGFKEAEWEAVL